MSRIRLLGPVLNPAGVTAISRGNVRSSLMTGLKQVGRSPIRMELGRRSSAPPVLERLGRCLQRARGLGRSRSWDVPARPAMFAERSDLPLSSFRAGEIRALVQDVGEQLLETFSRQETLVLADVCQSIYVAIHDQAVDRFGHENGYQAVETLAVKVAMGQAAAELGLDGRLREIRLPGQEPQSCFSPRMSGTNLLLDQFRDRLHHHSSMSQTETNHALALARTMLENRIEPALMAAAEERGILLPCSPSDFRARLDQLGSRISLHL